jgi:beta-galactosidase
MEIDRRAFLKSTGTCIAIAAMTESGFGLASHPSAQTSGRRVLPLNQRWLYHPDFSEEAISPSFDDSAFEHVVLPHSNTPVPWHNVDQNSYQFVSIYRRHFKLPKEKEVGNRRVFIDFAGVMTATTVWLNGTKIGEYKGGYTPFSFELTHALQLAGDNVLAVRVDSRELTEVPPFGYEIDYLTFGGIYREVELRIVPAIHIENMCARPIDDPSSSPGLDVDIYLKALESSTAPLTLEISLIDGDRVLGKSELKIGKVDQGASAKKYTLQLRDFGHVDLWSLESPRLYTVQVKLLAHSQLQDELSCRTGFRSAHFMDHGFELNGEVIKLRGLNRHQTFPFAGAAMPARVQRKDAEILKKELKCNVVRCSHYPQSTHFLDACDELGILVIDEIPGWQHVSDESIWRDRAVDNVDRMIRRDWNHPSVILWSIRINESRDFHDFYQRTHATAHSLDPTRQTTGVRYFQESELLEDVFSMNDFGFPLKAPNHSLYLNTEFVGAEFPTRSWDDNDRHREHILRYARIYNQLESSEKYAGGLGWCAFDYATHSDFGAGDHICYHGVMDIYRQPKPAAGFYKSQCTPEEEVVLEPGFHWAMNDNPGSFDHAVICSNCERLRCYIKRDGAWHQIIELEPARQEFPHLAYPPFFLHLPNGNDDWGDLRIDGYWGGKVVISKSFSGQGLDQKFSIGCDDKELFANGADSTRITFRVTDEYGSIRPLCNDPISIEVDGPATLLGPKLFSLTGGTGAVWIRARQTSGNVRVTGTHSVFGSRTVEIALTASPEESV